MSQVDHIAGHTYHGRKGAIANAFRYSVDYVLMDAEDESPQTPWLFKRNRAALSSLQDVDHGGAPGQGRGAAWAREVLEQYQIRAATRLELLAQPRVLGYVFNPVSFWLAYDDTGGLIAVIAEVTNTFGDRHSYLCTKQDLSRITKTDRLSARKILHVSPFQDVEGGYVFRFDINADRIGIWIDYSAGDDGLIATLTGTRSRLTNRAVLRALVRRPFGARRVMALIHWQALKLWWKGAKYRARPTPSAQDVSQ